MDYATVGSTGVQVSPLCFGTMSFGSEADEQTSTEMFHRVREAGINFFDTADAYGDGASEKSSERSSPTAVTRSSSARRSSTRPGRTSMREASRADTSSAGSRPA